MTSTGRHRRPRSAIHVIVTALIIFSSTATPSIGGSIVTSEVEFSDEFGGLRLLSATGAGTREDPFVVVEEFTGPGSAVLVIRGLNRLFGTPAGVMRPVGLVLRKVVTNATRKRWHEFDLELREHVHDPSDYFDGLSFDQMMTMEFPVNADMFRQVRTIMEPFDHLRFSDGVVEPGGTVTFEIVITDATPQPVIFLIQRAPIHTSEGFRPWPSPPAPQQTASPGAAKVERQSWLSR